MFSYALIKHPLFESFTIFVIVANSIVLALEDPTATVSPPFFNYIDNVFLGIYTSELILKVSNMKF